MDIKIVCDENTTPVPKYGWDHICPKCAWKDYFQAIHDDHSQLLTLAWLIAIPAMLLNPLAFLGPIVLRWLLRNSPVGYQCPKCKHRVFLVHTYGPY